jgi:hypothetical protein
MPPLTGQPLTHCPVCNYDLTGLPKNHRCPECGFEYDETTRIWTGDCRTGWMFLGSLFYLLMASLVAVAVLLSLARPGSLGVAHLLKFLFFGLVWLAMARYRRARTFTTVGAHGITYKRPYRAVRSIPWSDLQYSESFDLPMQRKGSDWGFVPLPFTNLRRPAKRSLLAAIRGRCQDHEAGRRPAEKNSSTGSATA